MEKLKPCPFCGKSVAAINTCKSLEECENFEECGAEDYVCVVCNFNAGGCGASSSYTPDSEKAIKAWNRRAGNEDDM